MSIYISLLLLCFWGCTEDLPAQKAPPISEDNQEPLPLPLADLECVPGGEFIEINAETSLPKPFIEICEDHLGITPPIRCEDGVLIPVTVDGEEVWEDVGFYGCDNSSLQVGQCIPGSTIQRLSGVTRDGIPLPEVVWVAFCRTGVDPEASGEELTYSNDVQVIGYNYESGATCFLNNVRQFGFHDGTARNEQAWRAKGSVPSSKDPMFSTILSASGPPPCTLCHRSSPFIHNDFVDSARMPDDPDEPVLPIINAPNAPYWPIAHNDWDLRTVYIEGNACLACHRINMGLIELFERNHWDVNEHMPPQNPGSMAEDYEALLDCWTNGPENTPGCYWVIPPGGECDGGIVDEDYPFATDSVIPPP